MKKTTIIALLLALCLIFALGACGGTDNVPDPGEADADTAMNNFVKKLEAGNYVVDVENYMKTTVYSPEQVYFTRNGDSSGLDFGFVTVNGETFHGILEGNSFTEIGFEGPDNAIDVASYTLPNYWIALSEGNIWNLFYNNVDDPLEFTSNDENVKITLLGLRGYGEMALNTMEEVHVKLDAEDPTSVNFTAHIESGGMINFDDLDITLKFGAASSEPRIDKWAKKPVYPPTRSSWTEDDIDSMALVFGRDYGAQTVPFPDFASYAMIFDPNAYNERTEILIRDVHATEQDVEDYKSVLLSNGYTEETRTLEDGTGETVYRKLLRPDYDAYAELYPCYEKGFALTGRMYYEIPQYEGQASINGALTQNGFPAFPETDIFKEWKAQDIAKERSESWAYFFDYELYMPFILEYEDEAAARAYFDEYSKLLAQNGLRNTFSANLDGGEYKDAIESRTFRYDFSEEGTVIVETEKEKSFTAEEVRALITEHGLPDINLSGDIAARDITGYYHEIAGIKGLVLSCSQSFASTAEAEKFLDDYVAGIEDLGYYRTPPASAGSNKQNLYANDDMSKRIGFDLDSEADGAIVRYDFTSIEDDEPDMIQSMLHR